MFEEKKAKKEAEKKKKQAEREAKKEEKDMLAGGIIGRSFMIHQAADCKMKLVT